MLAARDQENLVHGHQTAAASKPLNQSIRQAPPKTPGNRPPKTPFKVAFNDENDTAAFGGGKSVLKTNGKGNNHADIRGKRTGNGERNAFVTPMGPRNRAPLGMKTTNAKAKPFQTPAPVMNDGHAKGKDGLQEQKPSQTSRKPKPQISPARTTKVELQDAQDEQVLDEVEERDIEYMPPKPKDLPDYPDDFPPDMEYPQLKGANLTRGWYSHYCNPVDEEGERRAQEQADKLDKKIEELSWKMLDEMPILGYNVPDYPGAETTLDRQRKKMQEKKPGAGQAQGKSAATSATASKPVFSKKPTVSGTKASKVSTKPPGRAAFASTSAATIRPASRPAAVSATPQSAAATSRNTLGYAKGRKTAVLSPKSSNAAAPAAKTHNGQAATKQTAQSRPPHFAKPGPQRSENSRGSLENMFRFPPSARAPLYSSKEEWEHHQPADDSLDYDSSDDKDEDGNVKPAMRGLLGTNETALNQLWQEDDEEDFQLVLKE